MAARLENWRLYNGHLLGDVYDDDGRRWEDGTPIVTSPVKLLDIQNRCAQTLRTLYFLGAPYFDPATVLASASE